MAGYEPVRSIKRGITLIEVMISLILFSVILGLSSDLIRQGLDYPFIVHHIEPWINFMEEVDQAVKGLPEDTHPEAIRTDTPPLNRIKTPRDLKDWQVDWKTSDQPNGKVAKFSARTRQGKVLNWRIYKTSYD